MHFIIIFVIIDWLNYQFSYTLYYHISIKGILCVHPQKNTNIHTHLIKKALYFWSMKCAWEMNNVHADYLQLLLRLQF